MAAVAVLIPRVVQAWHTFFRVALGKKRFKQVVPTMRVRLRGIVLFVDGMLLSRVARRDNYGEDGSFRARPSHVTVETVLTVIHMSLGHV